MSATAYIVTTMVWNPGTGSDGLWAAGGNWTGGVSPMLAEQYKKVVFNVDGAVECELDTSATVAQLVVGDNGTTAGNYLRLTDGADLLAGYKPGGTPVWTAIGYNRAATVTVESGAVFETAAHCHIGLLETGTSRLDVTGGTVNISTYITLGNTANTSFGIITLDGGGRLNCASISIRNSASKVDLYNGTLVLDGDQVGAINSYVSAGNMVAYGGSGMVGVDYNTSNPGKTTVFASRSVPNVAGLSQAAAETAIMDAGLVKLTSYLPMATSSRKKGVANSTISGLVIIFSVSLLIRGR